MSSLSVTHDRADTALRADQAFAAQDREHSRGRGDRHLVTGQGTSLALVGAYLLAHELAAGDGVARALQRYEAGIAHFALVNQDLARKVAGGFVANGGFELLVRNTLLRALPHLPGSSYILARAMSGVRHAANAITLPAHTAPGAAQVTRASGDAFGAVKGSGPGLSPTTLCEASGR